MTEEKIYRERLEGKGGKGDERWGEGGGKGRKKLQLRAIRILKAAKE